MKQGQDQGRRYWVIWLGLLGVVAVLLAAAFLLNSRFRSRVGIQRTPMMSVTASAAPPATPAAAASASVTPVTSPSPAVSSSLPPGAHVASSPLEREIEAAYLHYWDVLAQGYLSLDASHLGDVMAGAELSRQQQQIADLRAKGRAAKLDVDHGISFVSVSPDQAVIYDQYLNRGVFVDATTQQEIPTSQPPETEKISFQMRKIDGTWKVVDGAQHQ